MDLAGYAISAGSACSSGVIEPSHVLQAMDLESWRIQGGIRVSFGPSNTGDEARSAADALADLALRLQAETALSNS
jgi:cysteine desulfurase